MMYWGHHMTGGDWAFSVIATLLFVALIVALVVWLLSATRSHAGVGAAGGVDGAPHTESAHELLDRRLASGELIVEEYERLREALAGGGGGGRAGSGEAASAPPGS